MRIKLLLVTLLVLSNVIWFRAYRIRNQAWLDGITWRHQLEQERDFFQKQALDAVERCHGQQ
jgi:hypothetical protein